MRQINELEIRQTPTTLRCIECMRPWVDAGERWRLKITDDVEPETVPYCPDCAMREFGPARAPHIEAS